MGIGIPIPMHSSTVMQRVARVCQREPILVVRLPDLAPGLRPASSRETLTFTARFVIDIPSVEFGELAAPAEAATVKELCFMTPCGIRTAGRRASE